MGAQLAKDEEELSESQAKKQAAVTELKQAEAVESQAKENGASTISEARQMDAQVTQSKLALGQKLGSVAQTKRTKAHAQEAAAVTKQNVEKEKNELQQNEKTLNNLKMMEATDKVALAAAQSKQQALSAAVRREGDAEQALDVEM